MLEFFVWLLIGHRLINTNRYQLANFIDWISDHWFPSIGQLNAHEVSEPRIKPMTHWTTAVGGEHITATPPMPVPLVYICYIVFPALGLHRYDLHCQGDLAFCWHWGWSQPGFVASSVVLLHPQCWRQEHHLSHLRHEGFTVPNVESQVFTPNFWVPQLGIEPGTFHTKNLKTCFQGGLKKIF
jgi:hypothetical protein